MNTIKRTHRPTTSILTDVWEKNFENLVNEIINETKTPEYLRPRINLLEKENGYELATALPGLTKENIKLSIEDHILTLEAKSAERKTESGEKVHLKELQTGTYKRIIQLPKNADTETTDASMENGILKVYLAKRNESLPKQITIK